MTRKRNHGRQLGWNGRF